MKKLIAGNWKMNGSLDEARALIAGIVNGLEAGDPGVFSACDILVCPPFLHIPAVRHALHGYPKIVFGAQDCAVSANGAHTGDVSASMLADLGCSYVIAGHSERRQNHGESDEAVARKARAILDHDMTPIICVGETAEERAAGRAEDVVAGQIERSIPGLGPFDIVVVAYEPVWAIGTGDTAGPEDVAAMHAFIRRILKKKVPRPDLVRILYGGSMKPDNAGALLALPDVDGGLIGGASLKAADFISIAGAALRGA